MNVPATTDATTRTFADVTAIEPTGATTFTADLDPEWTVGGKPNGGYLAAILGRAATELSPHPHVLAASAHFLRSPSVGRVDVAVETLREGRSASQLRVRMSQDGTPNVESLLTLGRLAEDELTHWQSDRVAHSPATRDASVRLTPPAEEFPVAVLHQVDLRLEYSSLGFTQGTPSGAGELRGWLALPEDAPFDPVSLLFAVDSFPPATFDVAPSGWVPTLELTVYVRGIPAPGPVQIVHRANLIHGERVDETCLVWDSSGRLVAQATQLAGIRLG